MTIRPALIASAALLALFAGACQPGEKPPAAPTTTGVATPSPAASAAPAGGQTQLASFKTGEFKELDTDQTLVAPSRPFLDAEGKPHTFAEYKGKVVVFNLWGTWCASCVLEMPTLARLQANFPNGDVVVLPIATENEAPEKAKAKLAQLTGGKLPFHYDLTWEVSQASRIPSPSPRPSSTTRPGTRSPG